jgi:hypothetical protein
MKLFKFYNPSNRVLFNDYKQEKLHTMKNKISGNATLPLPSDPGGNYGYSLAYNFAYDEDNMAESIEFTNIEFSGPGTWEDFSEGEEYPYREMANAVKDGFIAEELKELARLREENSDLKKA